MGQLQRDDRRSICQDTVELWEIEREETGYTRPGNPRRAGESRRRRKPEQGQNIRQRERSLQGRGTRQREELRQRRETGQREEFRQRRETEQRRQSRQGRETRQREPSRQKREIQQIDCIQQKREVQQSRRPRPRGEQEIQQVRRPRKSAEAGRRRLTQEQEVRLITQPRAERGYRQTGNPRPVQSIRRRKARQRKVFLSRAVVVIFVALCLILIYQTIGAVYRFIHRDMTGEVAVQDEGFVSALSDKVSGKKVAPPEILEDYLEVNEYSRPGTPLRKVKNVFVHYTANPGTSAQQNRSYFANLAETQERSASAHFIIGYEGELLQCIPLDEQAYAVATRNEDSISIECCYLAEDGSFTPETYETLLHTLAWLLDEYHLSTKDILRHYDCGGKKCPLYYVDHEDAWEQLLADVESYEMPEQ